MKLTLEQEENIKEKITILEEKIKNYENYMIQKNTESIEDTNGLRYNRDDSVETSYSLITNQLKEYKEALEIAEIIKIPSTDRIDVGTKFVVNFSDSNELELLTLVENGFGINMCGKYVSISSPLGKNLIGKTTGDTFNYKMDNIISGKIIEIIKNYEDYIQGTNNKINEEKPHKLVKINI